MARSWAAVVSIAGAHRRVPGAIAGVEAVQQHRRRAGHGLHRQIGGHRPGQTRGHAGVDQCLDQQEEVRRAGSRHRRDGVDLRLRHGQHAADRVEDRRRLLELVGGREPAGRQRADAAADEPGALGITRITGDPAGSRDS